MADPRILYAVAAVVVALLAVWVFYVLGTVKKPFAVDRSAAVPPPVADDPPSEVTQTVTGSELEPVTEETLQMPPKAETAEETAPEAVPAETIGEAKPDEAATQDGAVTEGTADDVSKSDKA